MQCELFLPNTYNYIHSDVCIILDYIHYNTVLFLSEVCKCCMLHAPKTPGIGLLETQSSLAKPPSTIVHS